MISEYLKILRQEIHLPVEESIVTDGARTVNISVALLTNKPRVLDWISKTMKGRCNCFYFTNIKTEL